MRRVFYRDNSYTIFDSQKEADEHGVEITQWLELLPQGNPPENLDQLSTLDPIGKHIAFPGIGVMQCVGIYLSKKYHEPHFVCIETPLGWYRVAAEPTPIILKKLLKTNFSNSARDYNFLAMFMLTGDIIASFVRAYHGAVVFGIGLPGVSVPANLKKKLSLSLSTLFMGTNFSWR